MAKNILIVDDQDFIRTVLSAKFEDEPEINTAQASDGDQAIMHALNFKPDLILLDIVMPKIDGLTILQDLKQDESTKHIPIVILSSHADDWKIDKAKELGVDEFIDKAALGTIDIVAKVKEHLGM